MRGFCLLVALATYVAQAPTLPSQVSSRVFYTNSPQQ
jgi:hypothetical protein